MRETECLWCEFLEVSLLGSACLAENECLSRCPPHQTVQGSRVSSALKRGRFCRWWSRVALTAFLFYSPRKIINPWSSLFVYTHTQAHWSSLFVYTHTQAHRHAALLARWSCPDRKLCPQTHHLHHENILCQTQCIFGKPSYSQLKCPFYLRRYTVSALGLPWCSELGTAAASLFPRRIVLYPG